YGNKVDYFDFGISTEKEGRFLNVGLITQKEEFGARAVVYDTYEIEVQP
ncbi:MAG: GNAT family N-acetyltransferase, partial [Candidatus Bathyarchaeia archaeon]